jgi:hypothetical protein
MEFEFFNDRLPIELVDLILSFLSSDEKFMAILCCKKFLSLGIVKMSIKKLSKNASKKRYISVLKWLDQKKYSLWIEQSSCYVAAKYGYLDVLQHLVSIGLGFDTRCGYQAAKHGHLEILMAYKYEISWSQRKQTMIIEGAIFGGHIHIFAWLNQNNFLIYKPQDITWIIGYGHLKLLKWVYHNLNYEFRNSDVETAIYNGDLLILKWLIKKRTPYIKEWGVKLAKERNHNEIVDWINHNM